MYSSENIPDIQQAYTVSYAVHMHACSGEDSALKYIHFDLDSDSMT